MNSVYVHYLPCIFAFKLKKKLTFFSVGQILRLADGIREGEGRVEILHDGHWGTICDDSWDKKDADVVCRQLGYREALSALSGAVFGEGNGHIWLADVECLGTESSIEDCQHKGWNVIGYCFHEEDASVICTNDTRSPGKNYILKARLCQKFDISGREVIVC